jgi:hypothetical protein
MSVEGLEWFVTDMPAVNVKVANVPDYEEPRLVGAQEILLKLPVVLYALYLLWRLRRVPPSPVFPD